MPIESASTASCSGFDAGSVRWAPSGSSPRVLRDRSMSRQIRATTVVSHPAMLSTPDVSARLSRSQASCTASSASLTEPSIRYATARSRRR